MRQNILTTLVIAGVVAVATPALAVQGGNGHGGSGGGASSSIVIATVNGSPPGGAAVAVSANYGDTLTFATTVERLAGWEWPMVGVSCYQDVNNDNQVDTSLLGPDIVFGLLDHPDAAFTLAGSSLWAERGGEATCRADLYAYGWKGGSESIRRLAWTEDWTATFPA
jgi:hypothetical protein